MKLLTSFIQLLFPKISCTPEWMSRALITIIPALKRDMKSNSPAHLDLLIDISGSMKSNSKIGNVKLALGALIDKIPDIVTVSIYAFNNRCRHIADIQTSSPEERQAAQEAVKSLTAKGTTKLASTLETILHSREEGNGAHSTLILTDGEIHDLSKCRSLAKQLHKAGCKITVIGTSDYQVAATEVLIGAGGVHEDLVDLHDLSQIFQEELNQVSSASIYQAKLEIRTLSGAELIRFAQTAPVINPGEVHADCQSGSIALGSVSEPVSVLAEISHATSNEPSKIDLAEVTLSYTDPTGQFQQEPLGTVQVTARDDLEDLTQFNQEVNEALLSLELYESSRELGECRTEEEKEKVMRRTERLTRLQDSSNLENLSQLRHANPTEFTRRVKTQIARTRKTTIREDIKEAL